MKPEDVIRKYRCDKAERRIVIHQDVLKFDASGKIKKDEETGFLKGSAPIAKIGIMAYLMADGTVLREYIPAETLFDQASMDSLKLKPVTNLHPEDKRVDSDNANWEGIGYTGENVIKEDSIFLATNLVITGKWAIEDVEDGRQELSPGYQAELVFQKGTFDGEEYDAIQVSRRYNHLALVDNARGGTDIRMKLDNADNFGYENKAIKTDNTNKDNRPNSPPNKKEYSMKYTIDGVQYDADQQVINYITKVDGELTTVKNDAVTNKTALDTITAERDTLKTKVDELEKRDIKKEVQARVDERLALERVATIVLDKTDGIDKLDNRDLKLALIKEKFPTIHQKIDDKTTEAYINAVLDTIIENMTDEDKSSITTQREITTPKNDSAPKKDSSDEARQKMIIDQQEAWRPKTAAK